MFFISYPLTASPSVGRVDVSLHIEQSLDQLAKAPFLFLDRLLKHIVTRILQLGN
jgi:hypothetical protein